MYGMRPNKWHKELLKLVIKIQEFKIRSASCMVFTAEGQHLASNGREYVDLF